jgi:succinate dehydrogenase/fumarate reductase-like Fe-S protein
MNGKNGLACITPLSALGNGKQKIVIRPLPGLPVVRDLVVDMGQFYAQYEKIKPYLLNNGQNPPAREHLQCLSSVKNSMGCTSVFFVHAVQRPARRSGGTRTSLSARPVCWLRIAS